MQQMMLVNVDKLEEFTIRAMTSVQKQV